MSSLKRVLLPLTSTFSFVLAACSGGGDAPSPAPTTKAATTISLQGGPAAGGLGALPGNNGPGISAPGNAPGNVPVPGAGPPASTGAAGFAAGRPAATR
jgi:hypothetical protein